jgi:hypothetical protein
MRGLSAASGLLVLLGACTFELSAALPDAAPDANAAPSDGAPQSFHLRIAAFIDGESYLVIKGNTLHWKHFIFAAPGRWDEDGVAPFTIRPIALDGVDWLPTWPDQPNPENRICTAYPCAGVDSSSTTLPIAVPRAPSTATVTEVQVRRAQGVVQPPTAANDYELIVLISDYMVGGAADYVVDVDVTVD